MFVQSTWIPATIVNSSANEVSFSSDYGQVGLYTYTAVYMNACSDVVIRICKYVPKVCMYVHV